MLVTPHHYRPQGVKKVEPQFTEMKERHERRHIEPKPSDTYEDKLGGKQCFITHNRKSVNEYTSESVMGAKKRLDTLYDQRNGVTLKSLGDKIYKTPEYQPGFFKDDGFLIKGSTYVHLKRKPIAVKTGNSKNIDFYSGIQLDKGPLNPNRKLWTDAVREEQLNEELSSV